MKMSKNLLYLFCLILCTACYAREQKPVETEEEKEIVLEESFIDTRSYKQLKTDIRTKRLEYQKAYNKGNKAAKDSIVADAQQFLANEAHLFFREWYGTPWTFEGHTQTPREGSIACGYFVTTTLRDMGFDIPRIYWAQQDALYVVKKLSSDVNRFYQVPMDDIVKHIDEKGEGLYIVGLDNHVGYIYFRNGEKNFVHSNYYRRNIGVMSEPLVGENPLNNSQLRVIGKILDKEMTKNWIQNKKYEK
ncbi:hypothetical protein [Dysgonomonas sp. 25]|uniref:hypothetical protein n=1 Tax=Dysgonomonas sp. 25 TaxID=2302933 RepID=UPI001C87305E|nr:hypothetical protein [Dysgonomonas sp. 25]NDV69378.1 hypothetical protein [Dysgonomonas sp. 25]